MMRKLTTYLLALLLVASVSILGGCGSDKKEEAKTPPESKPAPTETAKDTSAPGGGFVGQFKCKTCHAETFNNLQHTWHVKMTNPGVPEADWKYFKTMGQAAFDKAAGAPLYADLETTMAELTKVKTTPEGTKDWTGVNPDNIKIWSAGNNTVEISQRQDDKLFLKTEFYAEVKHFESLYDEKEFAATKGWEEYTCFGSCHLTGYKGKEDSAELISWLKKTTKGENPGFELGITCESCHGQGGNHVAKPAKANIVNPASFTKAEQVAGKSNGYLNEKAEAKACGACHAGARHQGEYYGKQKITLTNKTQIETGPSKHFTSGQISCSTCHTSHKLNKSGKQLVNENPADGCKVCHGKALKIETYMPLYKPYENHHRHDFAIPIK